MLSVIKFNNAHCGFPDLLIVTDEYVNTFVPFTIYKLGFKC